MAKLITPNYVDVFLDNAAWAPPIIQYLKPHQVQLFLDKTCTFTFHLWLTGTKLENTDNH